MIPKSDEEQLKRLHNEYLSLRQEQSERLVALEKLLATPQETELFKVVQDARTGYTQAVSRVIDLMVNGEHDLAIRLLYGDLEQAQATYASQLEAMVAMQETFLAKAEGRWPLRHSPRHRPGAAGLSGLGQPAAL